MKLCLVFVVIIAILWMKRPLFWAISGGLAAALVLYGIRVPDALSIMGRSMVSKDTITVVLSFYFITFLQRMMERRNRLKQAEQSLNWLFNNRWVNASAAPAVIGYADMYGQSVAESAWPHTSKPLRGYLLVYRLLPTDVSFSSLRRCISACAMSNISCVMIAG